MTLHDYVDIAALDRLLTDGGVDDLSIIFSVDEYIVALERDRIAVADTPNGSTDLE